MNVSLKLLILVAYIQDRGLLYTLRNQCLDQLRHLVFPGFCSDFCQYNSLLPTGNVSGVNGLCLCLFLACTVTQYKIKSKTITWIKSRNCDVIGDW